MASNSTRKQTGYVSRATSLLLYSSPYSKALLLFVLIITASVCRYLSCAPRGTIFDQKHNPINRYYVKYSWAWTLLLLVPLVSLSSFVYELGKLVGVLKNISRIVVAHIAWFAITKSFVALDQAVGTCSDDTIDSVRQCQRSGHTWYGFDISGHTFLLCYCVFVITEEAIATSPSNWHNASKHINKLQNVSWWKSVYSVITPIIQLLRCYAAILLILSTVMVLTTNLYFHTMPEKVLGFLLAFTLWYATYNKMYREVWFIATPGPEHQELFTRH